MDWRGVVLIRCDVTKNPVGTDTRKIGEPPCDCQGCACAGRIAELEAFITPIARRADEMEFVARDDGVNNNTVVAVLTFEQVARARELLRKS